MCSIAAAAKYGIPANIVLAVAEKEGGKPGQWVLNSNGTHDVGSLQFNTAYLNSLARYGITANDVAAAGCYPFDLAAWRLRQHIKNDNGDLWMRVSNYHSRTYIHNTKYRVDLMMKAVKWADWLAARFVTYDVTKPDTPASLSSVPMMAASSVAPVPQPVKTASWNTSGYVPRKLIIDGQP